MSGPKRGIVAVALVAVVATNALAQSPQEVHRCISRGIDFLKARQRIDGTWEEYGRYDGGMTALVTLALLSCDVPPTDPKIKKALDQLRPLQPRLTYVVALQTMVFAQASPKDDAALIMRNARWLMNTRLGNGQWSYGEHESGSGDNSNTQYALLGLKAAADAGAEIPPKFWEQCREFWIQKQSPIGAWGYPTEGATGSMTSAGISSLIITSREIERVQEGVVNGKRVRCNGARQDKNLEAAINWMGRNFSVQRNPNGPGHWHYYYLYGLERAGRLSGRRFFGDHDWFRAGVRYLLTAQRPDGSWFGGHGEFQLADCAFALLFLSKGLYPICINKLQYGRLDDWNKSPDDVNNLTELMSDVWRKNLNWQIVDMDNATIEDLLQAPIIQFSGHRAPLFTDRQRLLLKEYVEQGGYIMADANCSLPEFDEGFRRLCAELWPEAPLRPLDENHGVWRSLFELRPNWPLHGIDVSCRTAVFYSPEDLSCQWQHKNDPNSLAAFRIGANIVAYATSAENLKSKLDQIEVLADEGQDEIKRNFLQVAKIRHNGDWNPAPRAIANLMTSLKQVAKIDVVRQPREIDILSPNFSNYPLSYMHGRYRFTMNAREKQRLAEYLRFGGVLFADACCGSEAFDEGFRVLMREIFPDNPLEPIPANHELYTTAIGYDLSQVQFTKALGGRTGPPVLEGIEIDGRYAVIYSKYDLGCALERQQSIACRGYTHDSAIKIASNIVLYALKQ